MILKGRYLDFLERGMSWYRCRSFKASIVLYFLCWTVTVQAQRKDSLNCEYSYLSDLSVSAFPIAFYLPETGFSGGGAGIATFRIKSDTSLCDRPSQVQFGSAVTSRNQVLIFFPFELYLKHGQYRLIGELGFYKYSYNYFGLGSASLNSNGEDYGVRFPRFDMTLIKAVTPSILMGIGYKYDRYRITRIEDEGVLSREQPFGIAGGDISALQAMFLYDTRNNLFAPTGGHYFEVQLVKGLSSLGSSYNYLRHTYDFRMYRALSKKVTWANHIYLSSADDGTPFFS